MLRFGIRDSGTTCAVASALRRGCLGLAACLLVVEAVARTTPDAIPDDGLGSYEGSLVDGVRSGYGTLTWGDGYRYEGEFRNDRMHGRGELATPSGERYQGDFADGQRHGQGTLEMPNGDVYVGAFRNDAIDGGGEFAWANGDVYRGDFVAGERTGCGDYRWQAGHRYQGAFVGGEPQGEGVYRFADGRIYRGQFDGGAKQGQGSLAWPNGNRYVGGFLADQRHGAGHFFWRDGTLYKGHFAYDRQHGPGVKESPDGERTFQVWDADELSASAAIDAVPRCALQVDGQPWMFNGDRCVNGLAHGDGTAVRLDGLAYILDGRFVLGRLVRGELRSLALEAPPPQLRCPAADLDQAAAGGR